LLAGSAAAGMYSLASMIASMIETPVFGTFNAGRLLGVVFEPSMLLVIASILASLQLCWIRNRRRSSPVPWKLFGVSAQRFTEGWVMLGMLVMVGIPSVRIFAFLMWFGPYNLRYLFGF